MAEVTFLEALRQGLWEEMERDERVFILGEDVGLYGGAFKVTDGFAKRFGESRVIDTPISEAAIVGAAAGDPAVKERIWVLLTEAPDGGWGLAGHAHTNAELVAAARAQLGKQ